MTYLNLTPTGDIATQGFLKRDRVRAALAGDSLDRPPVSFWYHPPHTSSAADLTNFSLDLFVRKFDNDIFKVMSDIRYPMPMFGMRDVSDWRRVEEWGEAMTAWTKSYVSSIRQARALLGPAFPIVVTVYSAVTWAQVFSTTYARLMEDFQAEPALLHNAMCNLALNLRRHCEACIDAGADGIFLSLLGNDKSIPDPIYREFCKPYDLMILQGAQNGWLNILHVHSDDPTIRLEDAFAYPAHAISWATHTTGRDFGALRESTSQAFMGGWNHLMPELTAEEVDVEALAAKLAEEARAAMKAAGNKLLLAPGCSVPNRSNHKALAAMRRAVDLI